MKTPFLLLSLLFFYSLSYAQNQVPEISDIQVVINGTTMIVDYSVSDNENDELEILLLVTDDGGNTINVDPDDSTGDLGFPIAPGTGKSISWNFAGSITANGNYRIKLVADDRQVVDIQDIVDQVDSNRIRADLEFVQGVRHRISGATHLQAVKDSLFHLFINQGTEVEIIDFDYNGYTAENIIGWKRGQVIESDSYIIDGHFDTVSNSPGADDNGSAVVGVMEALRVLAPYAFRKSIKFIGFDLEEAGLLGSDHYVNVEGIQPNENVAGVFNLEMIGYYSEEPNSQNFPSGFEILYPEVQAELEADQFRGNFITNVGIEGFPGLAETYESAAATYVPELKVITILAPESWFVLTPDLGRSDHARFWLAGLPALMLTDGSEFRYPYYHTPHDTLGNLNFTFMSNVVKATVAAVAELAELSHSSAAVAEVEIATDLDVSPDCDFRITSLPNADLIRIDFSACSTLELQINLFSIDGRLIHSESFTNPAKDINTTMIAPGMYVLQVWQGKESYQKKVIIW